MRREHAEALYVAASEGEAEVVDRGRTLAEACLQQGDRPAAALALRAVALAQRAGDVPAALATIDAALAHAFGSGDSETTDRVTVTRAGVLALGGDYVAAAALLDGVRRRPPTRATAEAVAQEGFIAFSRGELRDAVARFDDCLATLDRDDVWAANARWNRGLALAHLGDVGGAERDLAEAGLVLGRLGSRSAPAVSLATIGWVKDRGGDRVGALAAYADAEREMVAAGYPVGYLRRDRAHTLIALGLAESAADDATRSAEEFEAAGLTGERAESLRTLAVAHELAGNLAEAEAFAATAADVFRAEGRTVLAGQALVVSLRARAGASPSAATVAALAVLAASFGDEHPETTADAWLTVARTAVAIGDIATARDAVDRAGALRRSRRGDLVHAYWLGIAELRAAVGERAPALHAVRQALRVLDEQVRRFGATEARANVAGSSAQLVQVALDVTGATNPRRTFDWLERTRASALRYRPVRPSSDPHLERDRAQLRELVHTDDASAGAPALRTVPSVDVRATLEQAIRDRLLTTSGGGVQLRTARATDARALLDGETLVSYGVHRGQLVALCVESGGVRRVDLGPTSEVAGELDHVRAGLVRVASGRTSALTTANVTAGLVRLGQRLVEPLALPVGQGVVVVPTGDLVGVPWSVVPGAAGRPGTSAPAVSLGAAARRRRRSSAPDRVVLAAGPRLGHAEAEIAALRKRYPAATTFGPEQARAADVLRAIDGAGLFHVACHGVFRTDNPLFSYLQLADGPLFLYDLEGLGEAPAVVVLSACDSARTKPRPGEQWLGLASTFLTLGTATLVASVLPVPDTPATITLVSWVHASIARGASPAAAVAALPVPDLASDPSAFAARAAIAVLGA